MNSDSHKLREIAFKLFDMNNDKKLSESDLFEFMKTCDLVNTTDKQRFTIQPLK